MPPRRAHTKSRRGCQQCKQRRVKCDESSPACRNCLNRALDCSYLQAPSHHQPQPPPPRRRGQGHEGEGEGERERGPIQRQTNHDTASPPTAVTQTQTPSSQQSYPPHISTQPSPASLPLSKDTPHDTPEEQQQQRSRSRNVVELELIHHYSTSTYLSCVGLRDAPETTDLWQKFVPREALKHDFLMNGLLAFAALHLATTPTTAATTPSTTTGRPDIEGDGPAAHSSSSASHSSASPPPSPSFYFHTALEYQNLAFASFHPVLQNVTPENCNAAFAFSILTMLLAIAVPGIEDGDGTATPKHSPMQSMLAMFEFLKGVVSVIGLSQDWLLAGPFRHLLVKYGDYSEGAWRLSDADTAEALGRLTRLNEELNGDVVMSEQGEVEMDEPDRAPKSLFSINQGAIRHLEFCFATQEPPANTRSTASPRVGDPSPPPAVSIWPATTASTTGTIPSNTNTTTSVPISVPNTNTNTNTNNPTNTNTPTNTTTPNTPSVSGTGTEKGHIIGWLAMAGPEFVARLRHGDPLSLLVLLHWAVLLRHVEMFWWSRNSAKALVAELAGVLHARGHEWEARTSWARAMVGLS